MPARQTGSTATTLAPTAELVHTRPTTDLLITTKERTQARKLTVITSKDQADKAGLLLRLARQKQREIKARYATVRQGLNATLKNLSAMAAEDLEPWQEIDEALTPAISTWLVAETARVNAAARQALLDAQERAKEERSGQVEELRAAAKVADTPEERRAIERQAKAVAAAPLLPVHVGLTEVTPTLDGISTPRSWRHGMVDFMTLVRAVAEGRVSASALLPNEDWLNAQASSLKRDYHIPGTVAIEDIGLAARGL